MSCHVAPHLKAYCLQDDLWQALTEIGQANGELESNQTLKEIMDTWTIKMGYPVITVTR